MTNKNTKRLVLAYGAVCSTAAGFAFHGDKLTYALPLTLVALAFASLWAVFPTE